MNLKRKFKTALTVWRAAGWQGIKHHLRWKFTHRNEARNYPKWIAEFDTLSEVDRQSMRARIEQFQHRPLISVIMPVYNVKEKWLRLCIESVLKQIYSNWELCIADDCSPAPHIRRVLEEYAAKDSRIKVVYREKNGHISAASNSALELATGEFCALLDNDDELSEHALYYVAEEINRRPEASMIYSDEDMIDEAGRRYEPKFKPDWSPDLFYSLNLITHLSVYRTSVLRDIGGFQKGYEGSQDYDLALRVTEQIPAEQIRHVSRILYHWRAIPGSVAFSADQKDYAHERARQAIRAHFARTGVKADVVKGFGTLHRAIYNLPEKQPLVTVILLAHELSEQTVKSVLQHTKYKPFEIIVVRLKNSLDKLSFAFNDARLRVIESAEPSLSAAGALNFAAQQAAGEVLIFLENGLLVKTTDWMCELVSHALRPEVGAVGGKTLYPTGHIKQAGLLLGINGGVGNAHCSLPSTNPGHFVRAQVIQNYSAVSAECMAIRSKLFAQAGGFDAENLPTSYFAIDLCLRLQEMFGRRIVWTPYAEFWQSRMVKRRNGHSPNHSTNSELALLKSRWKSQFENDPFYNPNLTVHREDFSLNV